MNLGQALTMQAVAGQTVKSEGFQIAQIRGNSVRISFAPAAGRFRSVEFPRKSGGIDDSRARRCRPALRFGLPTPEPGEGAGGPSCRADGPGPAAAAAGFQPSRGSVIVADIFQVFI